MSRYRETLNTWAAQYVPEGATDITVSFIYDDGYDPTFTDRPESVTAMITYTINGRHGYSDRFTLEELTSVGEVLTALLAIEDAP